MISNLFLLIYWLDVFRGFSLFVTVIIVIPTVVFLIVLFAHWIESQDCRGAARENRFNWRVKFAKMVKLKAAIITALIMISINIIIPSQAQLITYISLSQVDKYNTENVDSKLNPQEMIKTIDNTI